MLKITYKQYTYKIYLLNINIYLRNKLPNILNRDFLTKELESRSDVFGERRE